MSQILRVFSGADLRCGHDGLTILAKKQGYNPKELSPGEFLVFLNTRRSSFKLFAANEVIAYYRSPDNKRMELGALQYIPRVFQSKGSLKFDDALKELFKKHHAP